MRTLDASRIKQCVAELCISANVNLPPEIAVKLQEAENTEENPLGKEILSDLIENCRCAVSNNIPICQDTGMAVVFLEIGQELQVIGGDLYEAVNEGVASGYKHGKLRLSIVKDPLQRVNTGDNTPAIIHTQIVPGDKLKITVAPKGFGSENMSRMKMFTPSATADDIVDFVVETVSLAGANPCPPIIVGVGIGGDFEYAAYLSKKALCRDASVRHPEAFYSELEDKMLSQINKLGIGAQGFGGSTTALFVNIEKYPTHIAGLPVAVNIGCHVTRHKERII